MHPHKEKSVIHKFDLSGMKLGDTFIGCRPCGFQLKVGYVGVNECRYCLNGMSYFTVTEDDIGSGE